MPNEETPTVEQLTNDLRSVSDREVVAHWNIAHLGNRALQAGDAEERNRRIITACDTILTERNIPHEAGKLINRK